MLLIVRLLGIVIFIMGAVFIRKPEILKKYIDFWKDPKKLRSGGILALVVGVVFLIADAQCRIPWLTTFLGILSVIKGVLLLTLRRSVITSYLDWWEEKPLSMTRILGYGALVFGILLVYLAS